MASGGDGFSWEGGEEALNTTPGSTTTIEVVESSSSIPAGEGEGEGKLDDSQGVDPRQIFVSRIPFDWGDSELSDAISGGFGGAVDSATVLWDEKNDRSKGVGFVTFVDESVAKAALIAGKFKLRKSRHGAIGTLKVYPVDKSIGTTSARPCHTWARTGKCPRGANCNFVHEPALRGSDGGVGGSDIGSGIAVAGVGGSDDGGSAGKEGATMAPGAGASAGRRPKKCFAFKKGKCDKGDSCPFRHDMSVVAAAAAAAASLSSTTSVDSIARSPVTTITTATTTTTTTAAAATKPGGKYSGVCHKWKKKGKCNSYAKDKCRYSHPPEVADEARARAERQARKRARAESEAEAESEAKRQAEAEADALASCVRCMGLPWECTEAQIRGIFEPVCGKVERVDLPTWPDSGRSKGYCTLQFAGGRKAAAKALDMAPETLELGGRWLSVGPGRALRSWETQGRERPEGCKSVFVGNLSFEMDEATLRSAFKPCGKVIEVRLRREKAFAFIEFARSKDTVAAVGLTGQELMGRPLRVDYAEQQQEEQQKQQEHQAAIGDGTRKRSKR